MLSTLGPAQVAQFSSVSTIDVVSDTVETSLGQKKDANPRYCRQKSRKNLKRHEAPQKNLPSTKESPEIYTAREGIRVSIYIESVVQANTNKDHAVTRERRNVEFEW